MYEAVYAHPDEDAEARRRATAARQVATAAEYGFDGVVVRSRTAEYDAESLREAHGVDVARGVEVVADSPETASGAVGNHRTECEALLVRGGSDELNRFAVDQERVDVLARPFRGDGDLNHVVIKAARNNDVHIEVNLGPVLRTDGGTRVQHLGNLRKLRELLDHYDAPFVVSAAPTSHLELRAPRELVAIGEELGFDTDDIRAGLTAWGEIVETNRHRLSGSFISPGVERGRHEE